MPHLEATIRIEGLWAAVGFTPNSQQEAAIRHTDGPLYLPAGPGSGKTRVLLWRAVNLIVFHGVSPDEIYLSTFTEKAASQLEEGLRSLLAIVTSRTGVPYDVSRMYVGTVHSLCRRILMDRRFYPNRHRVRPPNLLDELGQYFYLYKTRNWGPLSASAGLGIEPEAVINAFFDETSRSSSKHVAVSNCISLFNRLSEERVDTASVLSRVDDEILKSLLAFYDGYKHSLQSQNGPSQTDFSLLQQEAVRVLEGSEDAAHVFRHVIVDEYQDTNTIQEQLFFRLASGHKNLCVVGDDDQALYRFRGATVENFVQFPQHCEEHLHLSPSVIYLSTNYRSRQRIVAFYNDFMSRCNWRKNGQSGECYRVMDKEVKANSTDSQVSVIASTAGDPEMVCVEVAHLVRQIIDAGKVDDPNQVAFLFPSLKSTQVRRMKEALETEGLAVYAPRAGTFLEVDESIALFGIFLHIFGKPAAGQFGGEDYKNFRQWLDDAHDKGRELREADEQLSQFVDDRRQEIQAAVEDHRALRKAIDHARWNASSPYKPALMKRALYTAGGLSDRARKAIASPYFERIVEKRAADGRPLSLDYVVKRATSLDWGVLDLFYQVCGFQHFNRMFDLAESGHDEGPICNLGLISQYLARFMDEYVSVLTADFLDDDGFQRLFFTSYLFALHRRGESEYEDAEDPFPKGRIPFLTIHQAKGLEFPVVVLGNPRKADRGPQRVEELVRPLTGREGEPLDRLSEFDIMRMFYVALSRAENLLVIAHFKGKGQFATRPFGAMLDDEFPRIPGFDVATLSKAKPTSADLPKGYSYTGDYLLYQRCPRQYMVFRRYGLVPSRSQTMMFGNLVHRTLDDLHQLLIAQRSQP